MILEHTPVFAKEAIEALQITTGKHYLDATYGRGGHSALIYEALSQQPGLVLCDRDLTALEHARARWPENEVMMIHANYADVFKFTKPTLFDGILADLGLCSAQLDDPSRGFSFRFSSPLDMRMDTSQRQTLSDMLRRVNEKELADIIYHYGEEKLSRRLAKVILERFQLGLLKTTLDLAQCAIDCYPKGPQPKHPATRLFQALRIWVNNEFDSLKTFLTSACDNLTPKGYLVVITFHSLEYTLVKDFFLKHQDHYRLGFRKDSMKKVHHPLFPTPQEEERNPRSRSARLHVYQKIVD